MPDESGQRAGYKHYTLKEHGVSRIYGGSKNQSGSFDSKTTIDVVRLIAGESIKFDDEVLAYISRGSAEFADDNNTFAAEDGDLIRCYQVEITASSDVEIVVVGQLTNEK